MKGHTWDLEIFVLIYPLALGDNMPMDLLNAISYSALPESRLLLS
jgi:hypothetical protein